MGYSQEEEAGIQNCALLSLPSHHFRLNLKHFRSPFPLIAPSLQFRNRGWHLVPALSLPLKMVPDLAINRDME
jgi:hypothetical protein